MLNFINRSANPVRILRIETSCSCTVLTQIGGQELEANSELKIPVTVDLPKYGKKSVFVRIYTNYSHEPISSRIDIVGFNKLPTVLEATPLNHAFFNLANPEQISRGQIKTREEYKDERWIHAFSSDQKRLDIRIEKMTEERNSEELFVDRTYSIALQWKSLPEAKDFSFFFWPVSKGGERLPFTGQVFGNLK